MTYHLLRFSFKMLAHLPFWLLYGLSTMVYGLLYHVVRYRRKIVRRNLTECFPEKTLGEIKGIERRFYRNFSDQIMETCKMGGMRPEQMSRHMRFVNINKASRSVYKNEKELEMTKKEFELLLLLMENKGRTLSKEYIFGQVWGSDSISEQQTLTVHIKRLRQKIEDAPQNPKRIVTVWGVGYKYESV